MSSEGVLGAARATGRRARGEHTDPRGPVGLRRLGAEGRRARRRVRDSSRGDPEARRRRHRSRRPAQGHSAPRPRPVAARSLGSRGQAAESFPANRREVGPVGRHRTAQAEPTADTTPRSGAKVLARGRQAGVGVGARRPLAGTEEAQVPLRPRAAGSRGRCGRTRPREPRATLQHARNTPPSNGDPARL